MKKISKHFTRHEFSCRCGCGFDTVDINLIRMLEKARDYFNKPIVINSACRCPEHNAAVGGGKRSQHLLGRAADIVVADTKPDVVASFFEANYANCGVGRYETFTHVDSRDACARWGS